MINRLYATLILIVLGIGMLLHSCGISFGQDHNHPPELSQLHETFYNKWMRPNIRNSDGERTNSCCNKEDCFPTPVRRKGDGYEALDRDRQTWVFFSKELIEQEQTDPVESPDHQSHACIRPYSKTPLCVTLGSGV